MGKRSNKERINDDATTTQAPRFRTVATLFYIQRQDRTAAEGAFEAVADLNGTHACRGAGKNQVARAEGHIARDVGNKRVDGENHLRRVALLHGLPVARKGEIEVVNRAAQFLETDKGAEHGTAVKAFRHQPGEAGGLGLPLQVAGGEIDAESHGVVVLMGKARLDAFAQPVYAHHHFRFMLEVVGKIGVEQRQLLGVEGAVGLKEESRLGGHRGLHLTGMGGIVANNTQYLHDVAALVVIMVVDDVDAARMGGIETVDRLEALGIAQRVKTNIQ